MSVMTCIKKSLEKSENFGEASKNPQKSDAVLNIADKIELKETPPPKEHVQTINLHVPIINT